MENRTELTREQAIKHLQRAKVVNVGTTKDIQIAWINSYVDNEGVTRHIATLNAIGKREMDLAKSLFMEGRYTEASNLRLTVNLFDRDVDNFSIGQLVEIQCLEVDVTSEDTRSLLGDTKLGVATIIRAKAVTATTDNFFADIAKAEKEGVAKQPAPQESFDVE